MFALPPDFVIGERYRIISFLGASENVRNYLAEDIVRGDHVRIKEFFPQDATRRVDGSIDLGPNAHRRRSILMEEARRLRREPQTHLLPPRATISENGTIYRVRPHIENVSLPARWDRTTFLRLLEIIEPMHTSDAYHLNLKPSNIFLVGGGFLLVDSMSPFAWERMSASADSNESIDVHALVRLANESGFLDGAPAYRISELRERLTRSNETRVTSAYELDDRLDRSRRIRVEPYDCPSCGDILRRVNALKPNACPVCREGTIRRRTWTPNLCPICRIGRLSVVANIGPLAICPICSTGRLDQRSRGILKRESISHCRTCFETFRMFPGGMARVHTDGRPDEAADFESWRLRSGRSPAVVTCSECSALFDVLPDERRRQVSPDPGLHQPPYDADEWLRIAHGLEPVAGNAECDRCRADFDLDGDSLTVMNATFDPFGFARDYRWRPLDRKLVRWLGEGKKSPNPGVVCERCGTEFDQQGRDLVLIDSPEDHLAGHFGRAMSRLDWRRIALGLPVSDDFGEVSDHVCAILLTEFRAGRRPYQPQADAVWRGKAVEQSGGKIGVAFDAKELVMGGVLRKRRIPLREIRPVGWSEETITLDLGSHSITLAPEPSRLSVPMKCGTWTVDLRAGDIAACLDSLSALARDVQGYA